MRTSPVRPAAAECDLFVVGAGPAGSVLALIAASSGRRVILADREVFPRDKLCGGFVSPEGVAALRALGALEGDGGSGGPDSPPRTGAGAEPDPRARPTLGEPIRRFRIAAPGGACLEHALPGEALGVSRRALDARLVERARSAGAEWLPGFRVRTVRLPLPTGGPFVVSGTGEGGTRGIPARAVALGGGRSGSVTLEGRAGGRRRPPRPGPFVAFQRFAPGDPLPARAVEMYPFRAGYCGINPVGDGLLNLCFLAAAGRLQELGGGADALLAAASSENPALAERLAGLGPSPGSFRSLSGTVHRISAPGRGPLVEIGDAAGMIPPVCGDGISMAIRSAALAGRAMERFLAGDQSLREAVGAYRRSWWREFRTRLVVGALLHSALLRPGYARSLVGAGGRWPALVRLLFRSTRGDPLPAGFLPPSRVGG
jgi:flavin-dependent dehydrogenase